MKLNNATFVAATFQIEGCDGFYKGYMIPGDYWNGWCQPVFTKEIADLYVSDYSPYNTAEFYFKADGDNFLYQGGYYEDGPELIEPMLILVDGKETVVYPFGLGLVWQEETSKTFTIEVFTGHSGKPTIHLRDEYNNYITPENDFSTQEEAETFMKKYALPYTLEIGNIDELDNDGVNDLQDRKNSSMENWNIGGAGE